MQLALDVGHRLCHDVVEHQIHRRNARGGSQQHQHNGAGGVLRHLQLIGRHGLKKRPAQKRNAAADKALVFKLGNAARDKRAAVACRARSACKGADEAGRLQQIRLCHHIHLFARKDVQHGALVF